MKCIVALFTFVIFALVVGTGCNEELTDQNKTNTPISVVITAENAPLKTPLLFDSLTKTIPGEGNTKPIEHINGKKGKLVEVYHRTSVFPGVSNLPLTMEEKLAGVLPVKSKKPEIVVIPKSKLVAGITPMPMPPEQTIVPQAMPLTPDSLSFAKQKAIEQNLITLQHGDSILPPIILLTSQPKRIQASPFKYKENALIDICNLDADQGLPNSFIRKIIQNDKGCLWMATHTGGIIEYDGNNFNQYAKNSGLSSDMLRTVITDNNGHLWIGTEDEGAVFFDGKHMTQYTTKQGLPSNFIISLFEDNRGNIWMGTLKGAAKYDGKTITTYTKNQGLINNIIFAIHEDNKGNIWFATNDGISKFNGEGFENFTTADGLPVTQILTLNTDHKGNLWLGSNGGGVTMYNGKSFTNYSIDQGLGSDAVLAILEDHNQNLWFGTFGHGITYFDGKSLTNYSTSEGLNDDYIRSLYEDKTGNIWMGTDGGISRFNPNGFSHFTKDQGLGNDLVLLIKQDAEKKFWLAPFDNGLMVSTNSRNNPWQSQFLHFTTEQGLIDDIVTSMVEDNKGDYWIGTFQGGISKLDGEDFNRGLISFSNYSVEQGLPDNIIRAMAKDAIGRVYAASEGGLVVFDGNGFFNLTEENGLGSNKILSIFQDNKGALWIGTLKGGVSRIYRDTITNYTTDQGLGSNSVWCTTQDKNGNMWFGTDGGGVSCFDGHTFSTITTDQGLINNYVFSIITDDDNSVWVGTVRGLTQIKLLNQKKGEKGCVPYENINLYNYDKLNGLKGVDFFTNATFLDDQNRIWWGTDKALTTLDLNTHTPTQLAPVTQLYAISIEDEQVDFNQLNVDKSQQERLGIRFDDVTPFGQLPKHLSVPHDKNHLSFQFSATEWSAPHQIRYQFMLDGFDKNWSTSTKEHMADYRNISPGKYTFMVRSMGKSGLWSPTVAFPFTIRYPWYFTWWALVSYLLLFTAFIWSIIRWRVSIIQKQKVVLETTVDERTKELNQALKLAEQATITKSQFIATISHEIRTPLNAIMGMTHLTLNTQLTAKQEDFLQKIDRSAVTLLGLINDILDFSKIEAGKLHLENVNFDLELVLNSVILLNAQNAHQKNLEFVIQIDPNIPRLLIGDPLRLGQVITNLCNNAIKFTGEGEVVVKLKMAEKHGDNAFVLQVEVSDTGIGISEEQIPTLFDEFKQADNSITRKFGGTGLGLSISKLLSEMMGGRIWIKSKVGEGSTFYFTCKMGIQQNAPNKNIWIPDELKQLSILICDDNLSALNALSTILSSHSLLSDVARSGEEVLKLVKDKAYDLLLIDQELPGISGLDTIMNIRENTTIAPLKSVLVADTEKSKMSFEQTILGVDGYLSKPYIPSVVMEKILAVFGMEKPSSRKRMENVNQLNIFSQTLSGKRILLAEDNEINSQVVLELLQNVHVNVEVALNGADALRMVNEQSLDLVLMDLHMPVMDGYEATRQIRKQNTQIPIIAITADAVSSIREKCKKFGFNAIITKPINPDIFYKEILNALDIHIDTPNATPPDLTISGIQFPNIPTSELNMAMGFRRFGSNRELYIKMLGKFIQTNTSICEEIKSLVDTGDFEQAHLKAHTLKGESGNLGADSIWQLTQKVEQSIKDKNMIEFDQGIRLLADQLKQLTTKLAPFFDAEEVKNRVLTSNIPQLIRDVITCLRQKNPKALDLLDELATTSMDKQDLETITKIVQNNPPDEAINFLEKYLTTH